MSSIGEVAEWSNALPWKGSVRLCVPWVRIPPSPPSRASTRRVVMTQVVLARIRYRKK